MSQPLLIALMGIGMTVGSIWTLRSQRGRALPLASRAAGAAVSIAGIVIGVVLLYRALTYEAVARF